MSSTNRMTPLPVAHAAAVPPYVPGRSLDEVMAATGLPPDQIVKLASNENPLGPPEAAKRAYRAAADALHLYPDGSGRLLRRAIARTLAVPDDWVMVGNGSSELIDLAARAFLAPGRTAWISPLSFALYRRVAMAAGARVVTVDPTPEAWHRASGAATKAGVAFLADPNNPTGTGLQENGAGRLLDVLPPGWLFVLDEAYREYDSPDRADGVTLLKRGARNLLVTRTFSKAFGLAGLRVGVGVGHPDILAQLNRFRLPIPVSGPALVACEAAWEDQGHTARARNMVEAQRASLKARLAALGCRVDGERGNFLLVDLGRPASPMVHALLVKGVVVRPMDGYGLSRAIRVTIGLPEQMDRFLAALAEVI